MSAATYATPADIPGLYYRPWDAETVEKIPEFTREPIPQIDAIDRGIRSAGELRVMFERLAAKGVRIPTAYSLDRDAAGEVIDGPRESWEQLLNRISWDFHVLWCIATTVIDPDMRDVESLCCG